MIVLIHPLEVVDWLDQRHPQAGVHVMETVGGAAVPLWGWIEARLASPRLPGKQTLRRAVDDFNTATTTPPSG